MAKMASALAFLKRFRPLPFHDFGYVAQDSEQEILAGLRDLLRATDLNEHFALVHRFEARLARAIGVRYALAVSSGTSALYLALRALGAGPGREVVTVANTWLSTLTAIEETGARCRFVDVSPDTGVMDVACVEAALSERTAAIVPVHMYGNMVDMEKLAALADAHRIPIVEDACQAIGARCGSTSAGAWGRAGCFSFFTTKLVGAPGDGGAVTTDDADLFESMRRARSIGWDIEGPQPRVPSRMSPLQVPFLDAKLAALPAQIALRARQAAVYSEAFDGLGNSRLLATTRGVTPSNRNCVLVTDKRERVISGLAKQGLPAEVLYPGSEHLVRRLRSCGEHLPATEYVLANHVSLPLGRQLTEADQALVVAAVLRQLAP
jgi:aminotransferase EvaB